MKLYEITVTATQKGFSIKRSGVNAWVVNDILHWTDDTCFSGSCPVSELDSYMTGRLESKEPSVTILTTKYDAIDSYISMMKAMISSFLHRRLLDTKTMIETCK